MIIGQLDKYYTGINMCGIVRWHMFYIKLILFLL